MADSDISHVLASAMQVVLNRATGELSESFGTPVETTVSPSQRMTYDAVAAACGGQALLATGSLAGAVAGPVAYVIDVQAALRLATLAQSQAGAGAAAEPHEALTEEDTAAVLFTLARIGSAATAVWESEVGQELRWPSEPTDLVAEIVDLAEGTSPLVQVLGDGSTAADTSIRLSGPLEADLHLLMTSGTAEALAGLVNDEAAWGSTPAVSAGGAGPAEPSRNIERILPVSVSLRAVVGGRTASLRELLTLRPGAVFGLSRRCDAPLELYAGEKLFARGRAVAVGDRVGLRITELAHSGR